MRICRVVLVFVLLGSACSSSEPASRTVGTPGNDDTLSVDDSAAGPTPPDVPNTAAIGRPADVPPEVELAFNGRPVPDVPENAAEAASIFTAVQAGLRNDDDPDAYPDLGHTEQLTIRQLIRNDSWIDEFLDALAPDDRAIAELHLSARQSLGALHSGGDPSPDIPGWTIIEPEPLDMLVEHYKRAGEANGIDWQVLAGINLIETGMGRIRGLSTAGAQGPMQFLPSTWDEVSEGGDINNPSDAIDGAARYLVQRGGLEDIREGLFGYNNSDDYVDAVLAYADLLKLDERALRGFYNWEIYVGTEAGTLWLPVGYLSPEATPAIEYANENPWALTLG